MKRKISSSNKARPRKGNLIATMNLKREHHTSNGHNQNLSIQLHKGNATRCLILLVLPIYRKQITNKLIGKAKSIRKIN